MCVPKLTPAPSALYSKCPAIGPPVLENCVAISLSERGLNLPALGPAGLAAPFSQVTASSGIPQIAAARAQSTLMALSAELITPIQAEEVTGLPFVTSLAPTDAVSSMILRTLS